MWITQDHPNTHSKVILYGCSQALLNAAAREWIQLYEPGTLKTMDQVPGGRTCEGYTTIDLAACSTPAERATAIAYVRCLSRSPHATKPCHLILVYDLHLANHSRSFLNLRGISLVATTNRLQAVPDSLKSDSILVRLPSRPLTIPAKMTSLAKSVLATGPCIQGARKFAHEAMKLCLDPAAPYAAILDEMPQQFCHDAVSEAARLEHKSLGITRPVHALELFALKSQTENWT